MTHSLCPRHVGRNCVPLFGVDTDLRYYVIRDVNYVPLFGVDTNLRDYVIRDVIVI